MDGHPLEHDAAHGGWLANSPVQVDAILNDPRFGVRPPDQPVPPALQDRPLGRQFATWLRMRDDAGHAAEKAALVGTLQALPDPRAVAGEQARIAAAGGWNHWIWAVSPCSVARLLGLVLPDLEAQQRLVARLQRLAGAIHRGEGLDAADRHAEALQAELSGRPQGLALLWQSFEAGAALLGQAVQALAQDPACHRGDLAGWLPTLLRQPGVILHTRRFAREALHWGEDRLQAGDAVLLRLDGGGPAFGAGPHRCPGRSLALAIAAAALETRFESVGGAETPPWPATARILALPNARIPVFEEARP